MQEAHRVNHGGGDPMWTAWLLLTLNGLFFTLRLSSGSGCFPRALKREEEEEYLKRMAEGDPDARSALIEHNLRLVAHIIKKGYPSRRDFLGMFKKFEIFR